MTENNNEAIVNQCVFRIMCIFTEESECNSSFNGFVESEELVLMNRLTINNFITA